MHSSKMRTAPCSGHLGGCVDTPVPIACWDIHPCPPWTEFLARACENITFPVNMRAVSMQYCVAFVFMPRSNKTNSRVPFFLYLTT